MDNQLRFEHVQRKPLEIRKVDFMAFSLEKRDKGRPKKTWQEIMEKYLILNNITEILVCYKLNCIVQSMYPTSPSEKRLLLLFP